MLFEQNSIDSIKSPFVSSSNARKASSTCDINDVLKFGSSNDNVFFSCDHGSTGSSSDPIQQQLNDSYEYYIKRLDDYYRIIYTQFIEYQSPTTGLFPIYGSKTHNEGMLIIHASL